MDPAPTVSVPPASLAPNPNTRMLFAEDAVIVPLLPLPECERRNSPPARIGVEDPSGLLPDASVAIESTVLPVVVIDPLCALGVADEMLVNLNTPAAAGAAA